MATTPESFVDALNSAFGKQTTQRAAHAKGVVLLGKFVPSAEAASVSKALHFKHEVPVTVRFSANTGMPKIADADPRAAPRGLAIRFRLPDGTDTDLVTHSYNGFPAKDPEEFQQFFLAMAGSKPGVPSPTPLEAFQLAARNGSTIRISAENPLGALLEFPIGRHERGASGAYHRLIILENSWVDHRGATATETREFIHHATRARCAVPPATYCTAPYHGAGGNKSNNYLTVAQIAGNEVYPRRPRTPARLTSGHRAVSRRPGAPVELPG